MTENKKSQRARHNDMMLAVSEISSIQGRLDEAYAHFNRTTDVDAMDACVYEINALRSRYNTALKHYRERFF